MSSILIFLAIGIILGLKFIPQRFCKVNAHISQVLIVITLFAMGVSLGSDPAFLQNLKTAGVLSAAFAFSACVFSIIPVYFLTKKLFASKPRDSAHSQVTNDIEE